MFTNTSYVEKMYNKIAIKTQQIIQNIKLN